MNPGDQAQRLLVFVFCIAATAFFASFASTFGPARFRSAAAGIFYSIGITFSTGLPAYFHFFHGSNWTFGRSLVLEWLMPILLLCFGITAVVLLLPSIPQKIAMRLAMILFFVICPILILVQLLPQILHFHHRVSFDLTWILYAVLWFRVREGYVRTAKHDPGNFPQAS